MSSVVEEHMPTSCGPTKIIKPGQDLRTGGVGGSYTPEFEVADPAEGLFDSIDVRTSGPEVAIGVGADEERKLADGGHGSPS